MDGLDIGNRGIRKVIVLTSPDVRRGLGLRRLGAVRDHVSKVLGL